MTATHVHGLMADLLAFRKRQAAPFEERAAAFVTGLRALTRQTGIVVSAEALDGENAQATLAEQPKGDGWYRYVDGGLAWRAAADHEAEKERLRSGIRATEQAPASAVRSMALRDTRKWLAALESER